MAGRGRTATLPSWMTATIGKSSDVVETTHSDISTRNNLSLPPSRGPDRGRSRSRSKERRSYSRERRSSRRSRSRSQDRLGKTKGDNSILAESTSKWRPRKNRVSNFDIKPTASGQTDVSTQNVGASLIGPSSLPDIITANNLIERYMGAVGLKAVTSSTNEHNLQQTKHARRLYVGGITPDTVEDELGDFFTDLINKSVQPYWDDNQNSILQVYINRDKCFAFVEFKSIELTNACIAYDGVKFVNRNGLSSTIRIRRPNDYKPDLVPTNLRPLPVIDLSRIGVVTSQVTDGNEIVFRKALFLTAATLLFCSGPEKVFIGGLPYHLTDDNVKELLMAFGPLKSFHLVRDAGSVTSKGYGFCEYVNAVECQAAIDGLNGMAIGDKRLTVRYANQTASTVNTLQLPAFAGLVDYNQGPMYTQQLALQPGLSHHSLGFVTATRVLKLGNMVTSTDLEDDQEYFDIQDDVRNECQPFGQVINVIIPRAREGFPRTSEGNIFVEFSRPEMARAAAQSLIGRSFADRIVIVEYFDEMEFANRRL